MPLIYNKYSFILLIYNNLTQVGKLRQVRYVGHELYGHLYIFFSGGDPRHDNSNTLLNRQILDREKESVDNLNHE